MTPMDTATQRTQRRRRAALVLVGLIAAPLVAGCSRDSDPTAAVLPPSTTVPPTTAPPTSSTTTTSTSSTTTTTTIVLPMPVPPPDPDAYEPLIEIGRIEIPKIDIDVPMYEGVTDGTLDNGPGHWPGTALPGQIGNVAVTGHRTSKTRPFRNIHLLVPGDEVVFTTADGRFVYEVTGYSVIVPTQLEILTQTPAYTATMWACHPPGSTRERYVIHMQLRDDA